jgi:hypothetical protein
MITTIYSKSRKLFPFALVAFAIAILASCSSSNQFASSFGKRKYTTGHFSDPVAKVKTDNKPGISNTIVQTTNGTNNAVASNNVLTKTEKTVVKVPFSAQKNKPQVAKTTSTPNPVGLVIAKTPLVNSSDNVSLKESSNYQASQMASSSGYDGGNSGGRHHYLGAFFICLLLWLLFGLIYLITLGPLVGFLAVICFIAAVVYFILWLVTLAS